MYNKIGFVSRIIKQMRIQQHDLATQQDGAGVEMTRVRTRVPNQHVTTSNDRSKPENKCRFGRFTSRDRFGPWKRILNVHLSPVCGLFDQFLSRADMVFALDGKRDEQCKGALSHRAILAGTSCSSPNAHSKDDGVSF